MAVLAADRLSLPPSGGHLHRPSNAGLALTSGSSPLHRSPSNARISKPGVPNAAGWRASLPLQAAGGDGGKNGSRAFRSTAEGDGGEGSFRPLYSVFLALLIGWTRVPPAKALFKKKKKPDTIDEYSSRLVKLYWPIMANLGFSGAVGLACGLALRAVGQAVAIALGIMFIIIQGGAYMGFIEVKWARVHKDVIRKLDVNADGKFDASDFKSLLASGLAILSQGVPSVGGFLAGFALAIKP